jgi:Protein of unknown function (DUF2442)
MNGTGFAQKNDRARVNNDRVVSIEFRDQMVYLNLADGRVVGNPLEWHPWLESAQPAQRTRVEMYDLSVYFPDLDDGLDIQEMLKRMPPRGCAC